MSQHFCFYFNHSLFLCIIFSVSIPIVCFLHVFFAAAVFPSLVSSYPSTIFFFFSVSCLYCPFIHYWIMDPLHCSTFTQVQLSFVLIYLSSFIPLALHFRSSSLSHDRYTHSDSQVVRDHNIKGLWL